MSVTPEVDTAPTAPDLVRSDRGDQSIRPSWSANAGYLNEGHRAVFERTKDIPGWQMEADSYKLYEMAYFAGDVILELGVYGGRSAVVELLGALSNPVRRQRPQLYGVDIDPAAISRSYEGLKAHGLDSHALLYLGTVEDLAREFAIRPTMVFVDADHRYEGVRADLQSLTSLLSPGVPVLCHDYCNVENDTGEYGVRRAATEWEESGCSTFHGTFGCSALFVTTDKCRGPRWRIPDWEFDDRRQSHLRRAGALPPAPEPEDPWEARARALEAELAHIRSTRAYRLARALGRAAGPLWKTGHRVFRAGR